MVGAVVCDIDGTIAPKHQQVNDPEVAHLLAEFKAHGVVRGICTGRNWPYVNGPGGITEPAIFDGLDFIITGCGSGRAEPPWKKLRPLAPHYSRAVVWRMRRLGVPSETIWLDAGSISTMNDWEPQVEQAIAEVELWRSRFHLRSLNLEVTRNEKSVLYLPAGVNKGWAVVKEMQSRGIDMSSVVGCGDGENDIPFLSACGLALVPADAHPALLALPNAIVAPLPGHEGVKQLLRDLIDGKIPGWEVPAELGLSAA